MFFTAELKNVTPQSLVGYFENCIFARENAALIVMPACNKTTTTRTLINKFLNIKTKQ
jgi:hypothetical protein